MTVGIVVLLALASAPSQEPTDAELFAAMRRFDAAAVERLLAAGANVNARTHDGDTALIAAMGSYGGDRAIIAIILRHDPDVNLKGFEGQTALMLAAGRLDRSLVDTLIAKGADVNANDTAGDTALTRAIADVADLPDDAQVLPEPTEERMLPVVRLLLAHGADPNVKNKRGETAITIADALARNWGVTKVAPLLRERATLKER